MAVVDRIRDLVAPILEAEAVELYDIEHNGGVLRLLVDAEGGVDIGAIQRVTRAVSRMLDDHDPVPGKYTLEVSSPGLERPLRTPEHFRRAVGTDVKIKTLPEVDGDRRVQGLLVTADAEGVEVRAADADRSRRLAYADIARARTVFEWGPQPKPGGKGADKKQRSSEQREATS